MILASTPHYTIGIAKATAKNEDYYLHRVANDKAYSYSFKLFENRDTTRMPDHPVAFKDLENALTMVIALQNNSTDIFDQVVEENKEFLEPIETWTRINPEWLLDPK